MGHDDVRTASCQAENYFRKGIVKETAGKLGQKSIRFVIPYPPLRMSYLDGPFQIA